MGRATLPFDIRATLPFDIPAGSEHGLDACESPIERHYQGRADPDFAMLAQPVPDFGVPMVQIVPPPVVMMVPMQPMPSMFAMLHMQPIQHLQPMQPCSFDGHQMFVNGDCALSTPSDNSKTPSRGSSEYGDADADFGKPKSASASRRHRRQRAEALRAAANGQAAVQSANHANQASRLDAAALKAKLVAGVAAESDFRGSIRRLTFDPVGTHVVQLALEQLQGKQCLTDLVSELHGCVLRAINSPHGNYVIQKVVETLTVPLSYFVVDEIVANSLFVVSHRFGCRVVCRIIEHMSSYDGAQMMIKTILDNAEALCNDQFGHHVIESILEHGTFDQKHQIAVALHSNMRQDLAAYVLDRHATYVIESALKHCQHDDQQMLIAAVLTISSEDLVKIAEHKSGFHIVKALFAASVETQEATWNILKLAKRRLAKSDLGQRVLDMAYAAGLPC